jgi:hypothetical protein
MSLQDVDVDDLKLSGSVRQTDLQDRKKQQHQCRKAVAKASGEYKPVELNRDHLKAVNGLCTAMVEGAAFRKGLPTEQRGQPSTTSGAEAGNAANAAAGRRSSNRRQNRTRAWRDIESPEARMPSGGQIMAAIIVSALHKIVFWWRS